MGKKKAGNAPRYDDAMMLLAILNASVGDQARSGMELLWTYVEAPSLEEFVKDHQVGSLGYEQVMALLTVGERLGTFVKNDVLNQRLTLDLVSVRAVWERSSCLAEDFRRQRDNPKLFENLEWLAKQSL